MKRGKIIKIEVTVVKEAKKEPLEDTDRRQGEALRCPAGAILDTWSRHNWTDGVQVDRMQDLEGLLVQTENSTYEITIVSSRSSEILVRGGRFFPQFTRARLAGSSLGGSFLKMHGIYVGFNMELHIGRQMIVTSRVRSVGVQQPDGSLPA